MTTSYRDRSAQAKNVDFQDLIVDLSVDDKHVSELMSKTRSCAHDSSRGNSRLNSYHSRSMGKKTSRIFYRRR